STPSHPGAHARERRSWRRATGAASRVRAVGRDRICLRPRGGWSLPGSNDAHAAARPQQIWAIRSLELWQREGRWMATLHGSRLGFLRVPRSAELIFELGPPGRVTKVAEP